MSGNAIISEVEFAAMEQILAALLVEVNSPSEEAAILCLHARLEKIYEQSAGLRSAKERLLAKCGGDK